MEGEALLPCDISTTPPSPLHHSITPSLPLSAGPAQNVTAVMEGEALLPCDISTTLEDDQPHLILFYYGASGTPIYT